MDGNGCSREETAGLYRRYSKLVYQICLVLLKNVADAEDASQTVFRRVMEQGGRLRDQERAQARRFVTARNECRDQL